MKQKDFNGNYNNIKRDKEVVKTRKHEYLLYSNYTLVFQIADKIPLEYNRTVVVMYYYNIHLKNLLIIHEQRNTFKRNTFLINVCIL